jgi:hypothetical protein
VGTGVSGQRAGEMPTAAASGAAAGASATSARPAAGAGAGAVQGLVGTEPVRGLPKVPGKGQPSEDDKCGPLDEDDEADMVPMIDGATGEWGGPTKGGAMPEPTRFGDWERKGRCTDFS